jgi:hypothetical protein
MKDAYEVLKQKESDLKRVRNEITSLRIVASLLEDDVPRDQTENSDSTPEQEDPDLQPHFEPTGTDGLFSSVASSRSGLWKVLKRTR